MTRFLPDITGVEQCVKHQFDGKNNPRPAFGLKFCLTTELIALFKNFFLLNVVIIVVNKV